MSKLLRLPAPAKLNLMLRVLNRRDDGFHNLQTVYQFVDLGECITFETRNSGGIVIEGLGAHICADGASTLHRACSAFSGAQAAPLNLRICVDKRTPVGAGLGGGSSDAATVLHALNLIYAARISTDDLCAIGAHIGSDVPVFIRGNAAVAEGVGDKLSPCQPRKHYWVIIYPNIGVSTAHMYAHPDLTLSPRISKIAAVLEDTHNSFQPLARRLYPQVEQVHKWLKPYAKPRLSGTGSCVFAGFGSMEEALQVVGEVPSCWSSWAVQGTNLSPLVGELEKANGV